MPGGVVIYDTIKGTVTDVAEHAGFCFYGQYACIQSSQGKIFALVDEEREDEEFRIVTYTKGDSKIKVFAQDGTQLTEPEVAIP